MPADYGFIAQPAQSSGTKTVADLIGTANAAQQLQAGNVELQKQQIMLGERKAIQDLFSNPAQFHDDKGVVDFNKLINMGMERAPTTFATMVPNIISAHRSAIDATKAFQEQTQQAQQQAGAFVQSLAGQPADQVTKAMDEFKKARPELGKWIDFNKTMFVDPYASDPEKLKRGLYMAGTSWLDSAGQRAAATPNYVSTGGELKNINPTANANALPMTLGPGQLETIEADALGNKSVVSRSPQGSILTTRPVPGSAPITPQPGGNPAGSFATMTPGQAADLPKITQERAEINTAAAQVPVQRFNNQQIVKLLDETGTQFALTGPAADKWAKLAGTVGVPWTGDRATNFQNLAHYIALQAQNNAKAMGAGTDAARELSATAAGSTSMTPETLKSITKVNDAFAAGALAFNEGMENAIKASGNNVLAAREFKNAWSQAFDPNVYRFANALAAKDTKEVDAILGKAGSPERKAKAQELLTRYQRLQQLVTQGR